MECWIRCSSGKAWTLFSHWIVERVWKNSEDESKSEGKGRLECEVRAYVDARLQGIGEHA